MFKIVLNKKFKKQKIKKLKMRTDATQIQMQLIERSVLRPCLGVIRLVEDLKGHLACFFPPDPAVGHHNDCPHLSA